MKVSTIKTHKITFKDKDILEVLEKHLPKVKEKSIIAVTSKIVSITQGRMVKMKNVDKDDLIKKESQYYLPRNSNKYKVSLTITNNMLAATAGIDESNSNGYYILWPKDPQETVNKIRSYLKKKFDLKNVGVIITDSKTTPFRWGVTAVSIAYSGFSPVKDYVGKSDIFGRKFVFEKMSIMDNLACSAALVMGEGKEQTPIAVIEDIPFVKFQKGNPSEKELSDLRISIEEDLYAPLLKNAKWIKGKK